MTSAPGAFSIAATLARAMGFDFSELDPQSGQAIQLIP
jgi:hypothetical protein